MNFRRLFGVYLLLLALSLASTRFLPPPPLALTSAVQPVTRLGVEAGQNVRRFFESIAFERDLGRRYIELRKTAQSLENRNRTLERELERLKKAAQIRVSSSPNIITVAPVVGLDPSPLLSRLTLGQGAEQGITRFMSATVPEGVVPVNQDGEVAQFALMGAAQLLEAVQGGAFTLEASLILAAVMGHQVEAPTACLAQNHPLNHPLNHPKDHPQILSRNLLQTGLQNHLHSAAGS